MGSFLRRIALVAARSRRTRATIASAVPKLGTMGLDDAGGLVNTGEENFGGVFLAVPCRHKNPYCLSNKLVNYPNNGLY